MGRQVAVRAKPVPMLSRHVLCDVVFLMDVQQRGPLQGEQQNRAEQNPEQDTH